MAQLRDLIESHLALLYMNQVLGEKNGRLVNTSQKSRLCAHCPICASCKKIRDEKGDWQSVEAYVSKHTRTIQSRYCRTGRTHVLHTHVERANLIDVGSAQQIFA